MDPDEVDEEEFLDEEDFWDDEEDFDISDFLRKRRELEEDEEEVAETVEPTTRRPVARSVQIPDSLPNLDD